MKISSISCEKIMDWPHGPTHWLRQVGPYIVTAGTYGKESFFHSRERLNYVTNALMTLAEEYSWRLQAWAIFPNHYHFVGVSENPNTLRQLIQYLHSITAKHINLLDAKPGRKVWFQYWDTQLTYERSFLARLNYVHTNPVRHGLVREAERYPWCSANWFSRRAPKSFCETVKRFPCDKLTVPDAFDVSILNLECGSLAPAFEHSMK